MHRRIPTPLAIAILLLIAAALAGYAYFGDTSIKQARRMKLGREFLPAITNLVHSHPEFREIQVAVGTAKTGCFLVAGMVETHAQLSKLQSVIAATKPPLEVVYRLKVLEDYSEGSSAEPAGAANGSQPIHPETNRASSAAGSRRLPLR
jgi:hypothetical protein